MNEEKTLAKESEVLISKAKKSANSTIAHDLKLIVEGKHLRVNFSEFDIPCRSCMGKLSIESDGKTIGRYCGNNMLTNVFFTRGSLTCGNHLHLTG